MLIPYVKMWDVLYRNITKHVLHSVITGFNFFSLSLLHPSNTWRCNERINECSEKYKIFCAIFKTEFFSKIYSHHNPDTTLLAWSGRTLESSCIDNSSKFEERFGVVGKSAFENVWNDLNELESILWIIINFNWMRWNEWNNFAFMWPTP